MNRKKLQTLDFYQVDAFTDELYRGNPAAVVPMQNDWLSDEQLLTIAQENNLSETAFIKVTDANSDHDYELRWFTPGLEVDLCGHATLAAAYVIFNEIDPGLEYVRFDTRFAGTLTVYRDGEKLQLDFPERPPQEIKRNEEMIALIGGTPIAHLKGERDNLFVYENEEDVLALSPDYAGLKKFGPEGYIATAKGQRQDAYTSIDEAAKKFSLKDDFAADEAAQTQTPDFVSRCFFPGHGIEEDPVTGSAHCTSASYWATLLGKSDLYAIQRSKREGHLWIKVEDGRVKMSGHGKLVIEGKIYV